MTKKPSLSVDKQVELLQDRGLGIADETECRNFLAAQNYYRFSGYGRYFQNAPHYGDDSYREGATFDEIRSIYDSDAQLREMLSSYLTQAELVLRSHTAHVIANEYGPYKQYLKQNFYSDAPASEPTVESLLRDIERSRERHILRFKTKDHVTGAAKFDELPVWSAVEAWSFGTLSK